MSVRAFVINFSRPTVVNISNVINHNTKVSIFYDA